MCVCVCCVQNSRVSVCSFSVPLQKRTRLSYYHIDKSFSQSQLHFITYLFNSKTHILRNALARCHSDAHSPTPLYRIPHLYLPSSDHHVCSKSSALFITKPQLLLYLFLHISTHIVSKDSVPYSDSNIRNLVCFYNFYTPSLFGRHQTN